MTTHFTLAELIASDTAERLGIDNTPPQPVLKHLEVLANGLEQVRRLLGDNPMWVSSGYRCEELNRIIRGSQTSAHMAGWAADFVCPAFGTPLEIVNTLEASQLGFDQLIQEGKWVHISFDPRRRREVLTAHFGPNGTQYSRGA